MSDAADVESFPDGVPETQFRRLYRAALERHTAELTTRLRDLLARKDVAPDVERIHVEVFPDEGGDGFVNAGVYFEGRNTKVSRTDPTLHSGRHVAITDGMQVPLCDPDSYDFDIREASVATVIEWFRQCWRTAGGETYPLAATIVGHDDFGGPGVVPLNARGSTAQRG